MAEGLAVVSGRILAISWATLPMSAPRAMQVCRLLAHLSDKGWQAEVITSRKCIDTPPEVAEHKIAALYDRRYSRCEVEPRESRLPSSWMRRTWRRSRSLPLDDESNWVSRTVALASRRMTHQPVDALVTFAQPWSDHLIGLSLKKRHPRVPWLAHFSDPWVDSPYYAGLTTEMRADAMMQERAVIDAADRVVFVSRQTADLVMGKYPPASRDKVRVIPHGFDMEVVQRITSEVEPPPGTGGPSRLRMTHTGSLYDGARPVGGLLQALADLRRSGADLPIELTFVGHNSPELAQQSEQAGLGDIIRMVGPKSWSDSLRVAAGADMLLAIDAPAAVSVFLPSKLIEYLAMGKPILGLTPDQGASADLLRGLGHFVARPDDPAAIASRLSDLIGRWRGGRLALPAMYDRAIARYDIRQVAGEFAGLLSEMSGPTRAGAGSIGHDRPRAVSRGMPAAKQRFSDLWMAIDSATGSFPEGKLLVVTPHALPEPEISRLLQHPRIGGIVAGRGSQAVSAEFADRMGIIDMESGTWSLPRSIDPIVIFLDHPDNFGVRRALSAIKRGIASVAMPATFLPVWEKYRTHGLLARALYNAARRRLWRVVPAVLLTRLDARSRAKLETVLRRLLAEQPFLPHHAFVPGRIMLVNSSLGPGGTERQVANTILGLRRLGFSDISLMCERLTPGTHDFYAKIVKDVGVMPRERSRVIAGELAAAVTPYGSRFVRIERDLPIDLSIEVILLTAELLLHRPSVVHAWQDDTCIKVGLAAALAGVPRIILGGRSVAPHHFLFHQPYMRAVYRALSQMPRVTLVNNSRAGAADYESWIDLKPGRIQVVRNGFDFATFRRPDAATVQAYRASHGLAADGPVVGTIMRFSEEKRPLLWLQIAAALARRRSDLAFLLVGAGVMETEVLSTAESLGLGTRLVLAGTERNAALALAAMDVFLLTSRKEGSPNVLVEAQALGVPVVSTDAGGAGETFHDGVTGRLVASDDPDEIALAVLQALDDAPWRNHAISSAPGFVRERFSMDRMIGDTLDLYRLAK